MASPRKKPRSLSQRTPDALAPARAPAPASEAGSTTRLGFVAYRLANLRPGHRSATSIITEGELAGSGR